MRSPKGRRRTVSLLSGRRLWIGLAGTALFLGLFFARTDIGQLADALAEANYWWVVPAIGLWFLSAWFRSLRWQLLLRPVGDIAANSLYPVVIIGYMANNLLPLRAGELVRAFIMGERYRVSKLSTLGTIAVERLFDGLVLVAFLVLVGAFVGLNSDLRFLAAIAAALLVAALALFLAFATSRQRANTIVAWLLRFLPARLHDRATQWASAFIEGLSSLQRPSITLAVVGTTVVAWGLEATMYFLVGRAFSIGEDYPIFLMVAAAANLAITLPSSSGGIGPFEFFAKETLMAVGVGRDLAAAYAVALHGLLLVPVIVAGLGFLWAINLSLGQALGRPATQPVSLGERVE